MVRMGWIGQLMSFFFASSVAAADTPLILSVDDATPSGSASGPSPTGFVTSAIATVSVVSGGSGSYTYSWAQGPGGASASGPFNPAAPTAAATSWSDTVTQFESAEDWTCTVTDTVTSKQATITVAVSLNWTDTT
jgi:hypothetical protein